MIQEVSPKRYAAVMSSGGGREALRASSDESKDGILEAMSIAQRMRLPREVRVGRTDLIALGKRLLAESKDDDLAGGASELAYRFFLALFPFFIFLAALGSLAAEGFGVVNPTDEIMNELGEKLPADAASVLRGQLDEIIGSRDAGLLSIGILGSVWAASAGIGTIMKKMNAAYDVQETRPFWKRTALAIGMTVAGGAVLVAAFVIFVVGQVYGLRIAEELAMGSVAATFFTLARWPAVIVLALSATAILYWAAPNADLPLKWITPGAVLFTAGWLAASYIFGLYVSNFGSYNVTYGTLGGVVLLLLWFYIIAYVLLLGAELNAVLASQADEPPTTKPPG